ncbi:MAG: DUF2029 domain-containing protein [Chloroflexi bacterium]|nr:MAG: DUF2029 domain-containing protein [Chloroflexota bacterium]
MPRIVALSRYSPSDREATGATARFEALASGCRPRGDGGAGAAQPRGGPALRVDAGARRRLRRLLHLRPHRDRSWLGIAVRLRRDAPGVARARVGLLVSRPLPTDYPPTLAWFVAPFAALPFAAGYALWNVVLVASLLVTWWLTAPRSSRLIRLGHLAFALALPSIAFGLLLGQVVIVVAAAVSICWWLLRHNQPFAAGLVLCLIALKPQLALMVPVALLVAGQARAFVGWAAGSLAMLGAALAGSAQYLRAMTVYPQLTLPGLVGGGFAAAVTQGLVIVIVLGLVWRRRGSGLEFPFVAGLCASLLIASFLHPQDVAVLLPATWLWLRTDPRGAERILGLTGFTAALVLTTPLPLLLVLAGWMVSDRTVVLSVSRRSGSSSSMA